jgi:hypothetical protein
MFSFADVIIEHSDEEENQRGKRELGTESDDNGKPNQNQNQNQTLGQLGNNASKPISQFPISRVKKVVNRFFVKQSLTDHSYGQRC